MQLIYTVHTLHYDSIRDIEMYTIIFLIYKTSRRPNVHMYNLVSDLDVRDYSTLSWLSDRSLKLFKINATCAITISSAGVF